jgi:hypothetical protein
MDASILQNNGYDVKMYDIEKNSLPSLELVQDE